MAERASLSRVEPTGMGLTLPFVPLSKGVTFTMFMSSRVVWRRRPPSMWLRNLPMASVASFSPMRIWRCS